MRSEAGFFFTSGVALLQRKKFLLTNYFSMTKKLLVLLTLTSLATACRKDKEQPTIDFGPKDGYSPRYGNNLPAGQDDPTDWTHDATWNATEQDLFSTLGVALGGSPTQVGTWYSSAYPNPVVAGGTGNFTVLPTTGSQSTTVPTTVRAQLVVVDTRYKVLNTFDVPAGKGTTVALSFPTAKYPASNLYRVYYVVYEPTQKTVYYRGHGDVKIEN
jgi:hypothetical protein